MEYNEYVQGISFKFLQPDRNLRGLDTLKRLNRAMERAGYSMEVGNTKLPERNKALKSRFRDLQKIPKMSTFAIGAMINEAVSRMADHHCFVNVGVWNGYTFLSGVKDNSSKKCVGVDNFSEFGGPRQEFLKRFNKWKSSNHYFYDMDYKKYFSEIHKGEIGFYIYDGHHGYENQLRGLQLAEQFFSDNCIILVDDTNWDEPRKGTLDFVEQSSHQYEILLDKTTCVLGHPTFWNGVMILQKVR